MRLGRLAAAWLQIAGIAIVITVLGWLTLEKMCHTRLLAVQTDSMRPAYRAGDALLTLPAGIRHIRSGDIVTYHSSRNPNELISHRLVAKDTRAGTFQTQGDALEDADPTVRGSLLAGRVVLVLPGFGTALDWLRTIPGLAICIYLPAATITVSELRRLENSISPAKNIAVQ